jgi:hypothetical protein
MDALESGGQEPQARDVLPCYYFTMSCMLYSSMSVAGSSFESEVHGYLDRLHRALLDPAAGLREKRYLKRYDIDVLGRLAESSCCQLGYALYRGRTDVLITSVGLFAARQTFSRTTSRPTSLTDPRMGPSSGYYQFTFTYAHLVPSIRDSISDVLERLSVGFEKYLKILSHVRGDSLDLESLFRTADVHRIRRTVNEDLLRRELQQKQDAFLDLYWMWKQTGDAELVGQLHALADEIRLLNPSFAFESLT